MNIRFIISFVFFLLPLWCFCKKVYSDDYLKLVMSSKTINNILSQTRMIEIEEKFLPEDITFACADIKYADGKLIFCELGDVVYMPLRAIPFIINRRQQQVLASCWDVFWQYLKQFNWPVWLVGDIDAKHVGALDEFSNLDGHINSDLESLSNDQCFKARVSDAAVANAGKKTNPRGIVIYKFLDVEKRSSSEVVAFKASHPEFLHVNFLTDKALEWKDVTYKVFKAAGLSSYIPRFKVYPAEYSPELTADILTAFSGSSLILVKPIFSSGGRGINFVESKNLDAFLKLILQEKELIPSNKSKELTFWKENAPKFFLVSDIAQSNVVYKNNSPYDPTMRVVFILHHKNGKIYTTCVAGCWMIPPKPLSDSCASLEKKHISSFGRNFDACVDEKTWNGVSEVLYEILPSFYRTVLNQYVNEKERLVKAND